MLTLIHIHVKVRYVHPLIYVGVPLHKPYEARLYVCWNSTHYPSNTCYKILALWRMLAGIRCIVQVH